MKIAIVAFLAIVTINPHVLSVEEISPNQLYGKGLIYIQKRCLTLKFSLNLSRTLMKSQ